MKIIFSRKGFDVGAGGWPSPIVAGRPLSFLIPSDDPVDQVTYADMGNSMGQLLEQLTGKSKLNHCHLDPDIDYAALPSRLEGWRGAFGQGGSAQGHLKRQGISEGDLFLFFGWFRRAEHHGNTSHYFGDHEHRVFGWLQIDEVLTIASHKQCENALVQYPWLEGHPHARIGPNGGWSTNTVYIARERLDLGGRACASSGYGVFTKGFRLTAKESPRSRWSVPDWLNPTLGGVGLSRTRPERWRPDGYLDIGPGQEFVANLDSNHQAAESALAWLGDIVFVRDEVGEF